MDRPQDFPSLRDQPLDVRLSAWLDGQTSAQESAEIEALVEHDAEARALLDRLVAGSEFGTSAFDAMLAEPVPPRLVQAIEAASKKRVADASGQAKPGRRAANSNTPFSALPQMMAASLVLFLAGGFGGYQFAVNRTGVEPQIVSEAGIDAEFDEVPVTAGEAAKTRSFTLPDQPATPVIAALDETIAGFHRVYSAESAHLSDMPVADRDAIRVRLSQATDIELSIPDLGKEGYSFAGARLLAANDRPMATLFYRNDMGDTLMVGLYRPADDPTAKADIAKVAFTTKPVSRFGATVFYGFGEGVGVFVAMPDTVEAPQALAEKVMAAF